MLSLANKTTFLILAIKTDNTKENPLIKDNAVRMMDHMMLEAHMFTLRPQTIPDILKYWVLASNHHHMTYLL